MGFFLLLASLAFAQTGPSEEEKFARQKAELLISKGIKAQLKGEVEDAMEAFDDAFQVYPANKKPLFLKGEVFCKFGQYRRAAELLDNLPLDTFSADERAEYHLLYGTISVANRSLELAAAAYGNALRSQPNNLSAKIRLALVNEFFGNHNRAAQLLDDLKSLENATFRERCIALSTRLFAGDLGQAYADSDILTKILRRGTFHSENPPFLLWVWSNTVFFFFALLPWSFGNMVGIFYLLILMIGLAFFSSHLTAASKVSLDISFVILGMAHFILAWRFGSQELTLALLSETFNGYSEAWILPKLLIGMHFCTIAFFVIFPLFRMLPEGFRPKRHELYATWFFCFWFMLFVILFQSRMPLTQQAHYLLFTFFATFSTTLFMPMGKYIFFLIGKNFGLGRFVTLSEDGDDGGLSFTDGKVQEAKAGHHLEREEFDTVLAIGRKIFSAFPPKTFPQLWIHIAKALIEKEEIFEAERKIREYLDAFADTSHHDSGLLISAFFKTVKGDHTGAFSIINNIPEAKVKNLSPEEIGWSLYILSRCNISFKENVQAHVDFSKALSSATTPLTKARILVELAEMDAQLNRLEWTQKWLSEGKSLGGGPKTKGLVKTIESIVLFCQGKIEEALKTSEEACKIYSQNSRAWYWRGHLLCLQNRQAEAEALLKNIPTGMDDADRLMGEITKRR